MRDLADGPVTERLHGLDEHDQDHHDRVHDFRHEALVAVADGEVAETAAADRAGHGRGTDEGHECNRDTGNNARQSFREQEPLR